MSASATISQYWVRYKSLSPWLAMACYIPFLILWAILFLDSQDERILLAVTVIPFGMALDWLLHKSHRGRPNWQSALITSGIVTLLMPVDVPLWQALLTVILALGSKHLLLHKHKHIFNPASFGVALGTLLFGYSLGWWPDSFVWLTVGLGLLNVWRVKKFPQVLTFLVVYLLLVSLKANGLATTTIGFDSAGFQTLGLALPWFFAFFMLPEPVTSLQRKDRQIEFGVLAAVAGFLATYVDPLADGALLWGLLVANLYARIRKP